LNFEGRQIEFILVGNSLDTAMDMPQTEPNENEIFAGSKAARVAIRLREVSFDSLRSHGSEFNGDE